MKKFLALLLALSFPCGAYSLDFGNISPADPLNNVNVNFYKQEIKLPSYDMKRASLSKNAIKNQYTIAMDKFIQSNVRSSYRDFRILIDNVTSNDYLYMKLTNEMASIGFFNLAELAMSKIEDDELSSNLEEDVKTFYFPSANLTQKDQIYLAEIYSNIMYNDQSKEATAELLKNSTLLMESDYANYLVAFGSMKNGNIKQAKEYIDKAISKNPKNINYKRMKAEILAGSNNPKDATNCLNELNSKEIHTVIFDKELHSSQEYVLYKSLKNEYQKKYHLAYYYYDKGELNKSIGVLQTSISGNKNINKNVYSLTARVYYDLKEYEKAQNYALKALDIDKSEFYSLVVLGDISYRNQDYKQAQNYYKKAHNHDLNFISTTKLAQTYQKLNEIQKAKELYSKILKSSSKTFEAYYQMALMEKDRELTYLKKAISINPDFVDGWIDLARVNISANDYDKASSYLSIAKYIDSGNYKYYYYQGIILKNKGLNADAKKSFERSLELNPDFNPAKEELSI